MAIQFTPMRVALLTGVVVFASVGAPKIASIRRTITGDTFDKMAETAYQPFALVTDSVSQRSSASTSPLFRYKDKNGRTHYVSTESAIPQEYRSVAESNLKLPKVTYTDFPSPNFATSPQATIKRKPEGLPLRSAQRRENPPAGDNNTFQPPPQPQQTSKKQDSADSSNQEERLGFIKSWLNFVKDTFNQASQLLS